MVLQNALDILLILNLFSPAQTHKHINRWLLQAVKKCEQLVQCICRLVDDSMNGFTACAGYTADPRSLFSRTNTQIHEKKAVAGS